jgi:hypothetical protein
MLAFVLLPGPAFGQEDKKPEPKEEAKKPAPPPVIQIEKSHKPDPCIIKPVMTDKDLRDCGAKPPEKK